MAVVGTASLLLALGTTAQPAGGEESFAAGSGRAAAKLVKVGPSRGALTLSPQVGLALSDFLNTRGRGDVRTADFAALEDSLPPEIVGGFPTAKVESTDENAGEGETVTVGTPPEVPLKMGAAELHAAAGPEPYGLSSFAAGAIDLGIGTMSGARAESRSGIVGGNTREATASVVVPRLELADGQVVLENLRWQATQRTGAEETDEAAFTIGAATIAGQTVAAPPGSELPIADISAALAPVLGPLGVELTFPQPRLDPGAVSLTPLRFRVKSSEAAPALVPLTDAMGAPREALIGGIRGATDQVDAAILLGDIALGVITGGSTLDIDIGGVSAATAPPAEGFSFGAAGGFQLGGSTAGSGTPSLSPAGTSSSSSSGVPTAVIPAPGGGAAVPAAGVDADAVDAGARMAAAPASSSGSPDRGGPMLAVGLVGLAAAAACAAADYRKLTTGRRMIPA